MRHLTLDASSRVGIRFDPAAFPPLRQKVAGVILKSASGANAKLHKRPTPQADTSEDFFQDPILSALGIYPVFVGIHSARVGITRLIQQHLDQSLPLYLIRLLDSHLHTLTQSFNSSGRWGQQVEQSEDLVCQWLRCTHGNGKR